MVPCMTLSPSKCLLIKLINYYMNRYVSTYIIELRQKNMPVIYLFSQKLRLNTECGTFPDKWEAATVSFNTYEFSDTEHEWAIRVGSPVIGQRVDNKL